MSITVLYFYNIVLFWCISGFGRIALREPLQILLVVWVVWVKRKTYLRSAINRSRTSFAILNNIKFIPNHNSHPLNKIFIGPPAVAESIIPCPADTPELIVPTIIAYDVLDSPAHVGVVAWVEVR